MCSYHLEILPSIIVDEYLDMEFPDHMAGLLLFFLRNCQTVFHSSCCILHSYNHAYELHFSTALPAPVFCIFDWAILMGMRCLTVALICISLLIAGVEHLFMCCWLYVFFG